MSPAKKLSSNLPPIRSTGALARVLCIEEEKLLDIAKSADTYWKAGPLKRKKGSTELRPTNDAREPLKKLHGRINELMLKPFPFPSYLHGSIHIPGSPRSPKSNAAAHAGQSILIAEDVANFFPSTTEKVISGIWLHCFHHSPEVASVLTALTTYRGTLPQGWRPSSYLANLALWDREPALVAELQSRGLRYTRYVDDIIVSASHRLNNVDKRYIIGRIYGMLTSRGYQAKRRKHEIACRTRAMTVTGLGVNGKQPTLPKAYQKKVRAEVHALEREFQSGLLSFDFEGRMASAKGKSHRVASFNANKGTQLLNRLKKIKPI